MERTGCPGLRRSGCTHLPPRRPLPPHRAGASQRASSTAVHALRTQSSTSGLINAGVAQPALRARGDVARTPSSTAIQAQTDAARAWEEELEEILKLTSLLPTSVRALVEEHPQMPELIEVVMDLGRPPIARFPSGDVRLGNATVTAEDLEQAVGQVGDFGGDNRAGIDRTLHRVSCIRNRTGRIIGLTCRVGRAIKGSAKLVQDLVLSGASILFLGRPGVGKTTAIREVSRALADELLKRVVIVDTSNEIGGDGDIPHEGIGRARRIQVPHPEAQHRVMIEAVENHMPEVVVIDEIGTEQECVAARTIAQRGVQLVATAHGNELENIIKNPSLADLVGGIQSVTLGDEEAKKRGVQKSILERAGPPTFDVAVEMLDRGKWRVHLDVAQAVDLVLAGGTPGGQVRERASDGSILKYTADPAVTGALSRPARDLSGAGNAAARMTQAAGVRGGVEWSASGSGLTPTLSARSGAASENAALRGTSPASAVSMSSRASVSSQSLDEPVSSEGEECDTSETGDEEASTSGSSGRMAGGFLKRSIHSSIEAEGDALDAELGDDGVAVQRGARRLANRQALLGVDTSQVVLRLFPYELDVDKLWEVMSAMDLTSKVLIVRRVAQADAVLGLRAKVKSDAAVRQAAKAARVPIYAIKATGTANMVRALRTLLGVDPAAGGMFVRSSASQGSQGEGEGGSAPHVEDAAGQPALQGAALRAETDIASVRQATTTASVTPTAVSSSQPQSAQPSQRASSSRSALDSQTAEALEEVRMACETLVMPLRQPVDLAPRARNVVEEQVRLVQSLGMSYEILRHDSAKFDARLRVLPRA